MHAANNQNSKTLNLIYRMINHFVGGEASIERSPLHQKYDIHKHEVHVTLDTESLNALMVRMQSELIRRYDGVQRSVDVVDLPNETTIFFEINKTMTGNYLSIRVG